MWIPLAAAWAHFRREQQRALASLVLGWWGIPWGRVYTLQAAWTNLKGGKRQTVGALLDAMRAESRQGEAP